MLKVPAVTGDTANVIYSVLSLIKVPAVTGDTANVKNSVISLLESVRGTGGHRAIYMYIVF